MSYYIYKISGAGMDYYGSSRQAFCERKSRHNSDYRYYQKNQSGNKCSSYKILEATDDWTMTTIENNIETETQALERENWYICNTECINTNRAIGLSGDDLRQYKTNWKRWNALKKGKTPLIPRPLQTEDEKKAKRQIINKAYREANRETILQKQRDAYAAKEFTEEERQKERDRVKAYAEANKERINEARRKPKDI
jgi:hypothetical protein